MLAGKVWMSSSGYITNAGDLVWTDFDPRIGRPQSGKCPVASTIRRSGTSVLLPPGLPVDGEILTSHVRSIDTIAHPVRYAGLAVPAAILADVRAKLAVLCGIGGRNDVGKPR